MSKNFELMEQAEKRSQFRSSGKLELTIPVIGENANAKRQRNRSQPDLENLASEEVLRLVQRVFLLQTQELPRSVVFASIDHGGGCSRICAQAAETLARNIRGSVCLVEANLRSPSLPAVFGTTNHHGLTESLLQEGSVRSFTRPVYAANLWLLSSGTLAPDSPELLNSDSLKSRFAELRKEFDFVLVDAPPLTRYSDAVVLGQISDGLILVLEANSTRREAALQVAESLHASNVRVLGAVLNKRTFPIPETLYKKL
jgi:capsular exopolysaccharide synthesis family protein